MKLAYLFTTFPKLSEQFLQREVRVIQREGLSPQLFSLWKGEARFDATPVQRFRWPQALTLIYWLPYWMVRRSRYFTELTGALGRRCFADLTNLGETWIGFLFGITQARRCEREGITHLHAVWATMPATAAWTISRLTGIPFSHGAHAYDVFRGGGDWILPEKLQAAVFVHTTTSQCRDELLRRGAPPERVHLIRRGFDELPECRPPRPERRPLRLLSVGRLVEKKGYFEQLELYAFLRDEKFSFTAQILGGGPLQEDLQRRIDLLGLSKRVFLLGSQPYETVAQAYAACDALVFTGKIATSGDRDGLPNVIPEAMALGLPVVTSPVAGTTEAVSDGKTGFVAELDDWAAWRAAFDRLQSSNDLYAKIRAAAREWVEQNYDNRRNVAELAKKFLTYDV